MEDFKNEILDYDGSFERTLIGIYVWMGIALAITGMTAYYVANNMNILLYTLSFYWIFLILELGTVIFLSIRLVYLSRGAARLCLILYSILNGVSLSGVLIYYEIGTIQTAFFVSAGMFVVMAAYGTFTKTDLSRIGSVCSMALIGLIIASIVGIFIPSQGYSLSLAYIGVLIFVGLIAWDTQKLKRLHAENTIKNLEVYGALILYLDFVNLFLQLLRIIAHRRSND